MGKIRPRYIKNLARKLLELYGDRFTIDFQENKKLVSKLADIPSKKVRNKVAGYIAHVLKLRQMGKEEEVMEVE